ncbi:MAG: DNA cytosine methyltransferase [Desulfobulbaceae bacterium]|nr:DNA cytosine methyltransferase [Desulfobulbaceae bacterium]
MMLNGFTVADLFCGAGGMSLGFKQAGFRAVFAIDHDAPAIATYRANFGEHALCADIREVADFPNVDIVIGGPPCQGFSRLGKQAKLERPENLLWKEYIRYVEAVRPMVFVIENVPEFFKDPAFEGVKSETERLGYSYTAGILNAADYGVPQRRQRAFVIASRLGIPHLPEPTHQQHATLFSDLPLWRTVRDAISDLPLAPNNMNRHDVKNSSALSLERYRHVPPGGNRKSLPDHLQLECWRNRKPSSGGATDLLGRLTWDAPSLTIRTQFLKPEKGCYLHPEANRPITVREGARLQTFPDDFIFVGSNFQAAKQIGNAVPVELAHHIALAVLEHINSYRTTEGIVKNNTLIYSSSVVAD